MQRQHRPPPCYSSTPSLSHYTAHLSPPQLKPFLDVYRWNSHFLEVRNIRIVLDDCNDFETAEPDILSTQLPPANTSGHQNSAARIQNKEQLQQQRRAVFVILLPRVLLSLISRADIPDPEEVAPIVVDGLKVKFPYKRIMGLNGLALPI